MSRLLGIGALLLTLARPAAAQAGDQPVRLRLLLDDAPSVGRKAPAIVLPYATRSGVGPADQPFTLAREIGRVVVLVFYPGNFTAASTAEWQALRERSATLAPEGVVLVGISTDSLVAHVRFASDLDLPFKLLSDADRAIIQRYGVADGPRARRAARRPGRERGRSASYVLLPGFGGGRQRIVGESARGRERRVPRLDGFEPGLDLGLRGLRQHLRGGVVVAVGVGATGGELGKRDYRGAPWAGRFLSSTCRKAWPTASGRAVPRPRRTPRTGSPRFSCRRGPMAFR